MARRSLNTVMVLVALGVVGAAGSDAHAQAWVGEQGGLTLGLDYNFATSSKVIGDSTLSFPNTGTQTHQLTMGVEYIPVKNLALNLELPFVFLKYTGDKTSFPHPGGGTYDDGKVHSTLTDLRFGARYMVLEDPVALSPFIAVSIPVADYETIGNSVAGRHLKALHVGAAIGTVFADAFYLHLAYEFSFVERYDRVPATKRFGQNRSDVTFTIGYKLLNDRLDLNLDANARQTHGGLAFTEFDTLTANELLYHDALLKEQIVLVGGGLGYQLANSVSMTLAARFFVHGENTQNASVFALGLAWSPL